MNTIYGSSDQSVELKAGESITINVPTGSTGYYVKLPLQSDSGFTALNPGNNTLGPFMNVERFRIFCTAGLITYQSGPVNLPVTDAEKTAFQSTYNLVGYTPNPDGGIGKLTAPLGVCVYQKNDDRSKVAVGSSDAQDFVETVLHTAKIPGGLCGPNSRVHIYHNWRYTGGAASTKNFIVRANGQSIAAITTATAANQASQFVTEIILRDSLIAQSVYNSTQFGTNSANAYIDLAEDFSADVTLTIAARWTDTATDPVAGNLITCIGATVVVFP